MQYLMLTGKGQDYLRDLGENDAVWNAPPSDKRRQDMEVLFEIDEGSDELPGGLLVRFSAEELTRTPIDPVLPRGSVRETLRRLFEAGYIEITDESIGPL